MSHTLLKVNINNVKLNMSLLCFLSLQTFQHDGEEVVVWRHRLRPEQEGGAGEDGRDERQSVTEDVHVRYGEWTS